MAKKAETADENGFVFHAEKHQAKTAAKPLKKAGLFKRRPGLAITLADLALILLIAVFVVPRLQNRGSSTVWQGRRFTLQMQTFAGKSLIDLRISGLDDGLQGKTVTALFYAGEADEPFGRQSAALPAAGLEAAANLIADALKGGQLKAVIYYENLPIAELKTAVIQNTD